MFRFRLYGLSLASDRRIEGLARANSHAGADVRIRFAVRTSEPPTDDGLELFASLEDEGAEYLRVLRDANGGFVFRFCDGARFELSARGERIDASWPERLTFRDVTSHLLGPVLGFVVRLRGTLCLHASAVLVDGAAIAFLGPSGAGKSSLCAHFAQHGADVLTDDVLALRRSPRGFRVLAGPARLRLWPDSARHLYGRRAILPRVLPSDPTWDKRYRDVAPTAAAVPLAAIYARGAAGSPNPRVSAATGREAFLSLAANRYPVRLPVPGRSDVEFEMLAALAGQVPLRRIHTRRGLGGLGALHDAVRSDLRGLLAGAGRRAGAHARIAG